MFQRGSKIVVIESSASKRSHPAVGDMGYMNNMYLFYLDKFILLDAMFSHYKSDKSDRCERKKLIIDLGMATKLRKTLLNTGADRAFFAENKHVINLNMTGYYFPGALLDVPRMYSGDGLWTRLQNNKGKFLTNSHIKINIGNIAMASAIHNRKEILAPSSMQAWMRSMTPIFSTHLNGIPHSGAEVGIDTINDKLNDLYSSIHPIISSKESGYGIKMRLRMKPSWTATSGLINVLRKAQSLSHMYIGRMDESHINRINPPNSKMLRTAWQTDLNKLWGKSIRERVPREQVQTVMSVFFRSIFAPGNTYDKLIKIKRFVPCTDNGFDMLCMRFDKIRKEAICNSAALARIYDEKLLKQHKLRLKQ